MSTERETRRRERQSRAAKNGAYDADKAAKELQDAEITIDGKVFHRVLTNNAVSREVQAAGQRQSRHLRQAQSLRLQIDDLGRDPDDPDRLLPLSAKELDQADDLEARALEAEQQAEDITYELVIIMLRDDEGNPPDEGVLRTKVAVQSLRELAKFGGANVLEGPTATESTSD